MSLISRGNVAAMQESVRFGARAAVFETSSGESEEAPPGHVLAPIYPIMSKYGVTCTPTEFYRSINLAFHRAESRVYDRIHRCMWESLPQQCHLLVQDYLDTGAKVGHELMALDIGCGTGLASEMLLNSQLGIRISNIDLLDTSQEMLERAKERAGTWSATASLLYGGLERLVGGSRRYDVIIICSVLHHIPDLEEFLKGVRTIQSPGGILLHLQDPNGDFLDDSVLKQRISELSSRTRRLPGWLRKLDPRRVLSAVCRRVCGRQPYDYIRQVNDELIAAKITAKAMNPQDLWTVTDIHCPYGLGFRTSQLCRYLSGYRLVSKRSYGFFGKLCSELPAAFKEKEQHLIQGKAPNGLQIAAVWQKDD